ncbi:MAG: recombinase family protein [Cetobacterium sp.]|uniref:recombinase family protein n=1 Tax=Cetobacterium sp. TaxID=2071632 RepID=UPI003F2B9D24
MRSYGYGRVNTKNQSLKKQVQLILDQGVPLENIYWDIFYENEKESNLERLIAILKSGDSLVIRNLDKLGSSLEEIKRRVVFLLKRKIKLKILENRSLQEYIKNLENDDSVFLEKKLEGALELLLIMEKNSRHRVGKNSSEKDPEKREINCEELNKFKFLYEKYRNKKIRKKDVLEKMEIDKNDFQIYEKHLEMR